MSSDYACVCINPGGQKRLHDTQRLRSWDFQPKEEQRQISAGFEQHIHWSPERFLNWAGDIGAETREVVRCLLQEETPEKIVTI